MLLFVSQQGVYCEVLVVPVVIIAFHASLYWSPEQLTRFSSTVAVGRFGRLGLDLHFVFLLFWQFHFKLPFI